MSSRVWSETDTDAGLIVVGVDGSEAAMDALRWAVVEARCTGARVEAVYVYSAPLQVRRPRNGRAGLAPPLPADRSAVVRAAEDELARAVRRALSEPSAVLMTTTVVSHESAAGALAHHAEQADLLVVGSRRTPRRGHLFRSTTAELLRSTPCPLVVIPAGEKASSADETHNELTPV